MVKPTVLPIAPRQHAGSFTLSGPMRPSPLSSRHQHYANLNLFGTNGPRLDAILAADVRRSACKAWATPGQANRKGPQYSLHRH